MNHPQKSMDFHICSPDHPTSMLDFFSQRVSPSQWLKSAFPPKNQWRKGSGFSGSQRHVFPISLGGWAIPEISGNLEIQGGAPKIAKLAYNSHNYGLW